MCVCVSVAIACARRERCEAKPFSLGSCKFVFWGVFEGGITWISNRRPLSLPVAGTCVCVLLCLHRSVVDAL
jgi:hypothetical protein